MSCRIPGVIFRRLAAVLACFCLGSHGWAASEGQAPHLFPDYTGITLPPNIAPLNFKIQESATAYRAELRSVNGAPIVLTSSSSSIRIPRKAWSRLLQENLGQPFYWDISIRSGAASWRQFATVTNFIAREEIDGWLAYRLLKPIFNYYTHLGIYQRDLASYEQRLILEQNQDNDSCLNCHMPLNRNPDTFAFNIRGGGTKNPLILVVSNEPVRVDKTMGYLAWHPSGRAIVFSANKLSLLFHTRGETRDVYDARSDLGIFLIDSNRFLFPPEISAPDRNETWPTWSPDGKYLYFSSASVQPIEKMGTNRYDLMRVGFDLGTGTWTKPELIISSAETGQSILEPKISPDGRFLVVTACKSGSFPIFKPESDLLVMDLETRALRRPDINSNQADTWHSWSSNSRWLVFSSKRIDALLARPHFSYVDANGNFHKPFVLPQEDPAFYGFCLNTFNVPEFMSGPVQVKESDLVRTIYRPRKVLTPEGPPAPGSQPVQEDSLYQRIHQ